MRLECEDVNWREHTVMFSNSHTKKEKSQRNPIRRQGFSNQSWAMLGIYNHICEVSSKHEKMPRIKVSFRLIGGSQINYYWNKLLRTTSSRWILLDERFVLLFYIINGTKEWFICLPCYAGSHAQPQFNWTSNDAMLAFVFHRVFYSVEVKQKFWFNAMHKTAGILLRI